MLTGETTLPITVESGGSGGSYNGPQIGSLGGVGFNSGTLTVFGGGGATVTNSSGGNGAGGRVILTYYVIS